MLYHILDTETASLKGGVCEIAWLVVDDNLEVKSEFCSLVNPERPIDPGAQAVHGISDADVADKPTLKQIADEHLPEPIVIVGHNCAFDIRMVKEHIKVSESICTLALARKYIKGTTNHKLETLQTELKFPEQKSHSALGDVYTARDLLLHLNSKFEVTLQSALADSKIPRLVHLMPFGKHKGRALLQLPRDYREWLLQQELDKDLRFSLEKIRSI